MSIKKRHVALLLLLSFSFVLLIYLFIKIPKIETELRQNIRSDVVYSIAQVMENFEYHVVTVLAVHHTDSLYELLHDESTLRNVLERELSLLVTEEFEYVYVLYRDDEGKFRFMLDGSPTDKARFNSKFDIQSDIWNLSYDTRSIQILEQQDMTRVWMTYLKPLQYRGQTIGIAAVDFSLERAEKISGIIEPLKKTLLIIFGLIGIIGAITFVQYLLYHFTRKKAYIDPLTSVYNRQFLNDTLDTINYQKYVIALIDLDRFKQINDTYGHPVGDTVLKRVSESLKNSIRPEDLLFRYGGEEFLILMPMHDMNEAQEIDFMERLRREIENLAVPVQNMSIRPTISIGLNAYSDHSKDAHEAIRIADQMLYKAKKSGRNRVVSFDPSHSGKRLRAETMLSVHHVKEALEEDRVFCEYQPIVDNRDHSIVKYEALIRIRDSDGSVIYPNMFLNNIKHSTIYKEMTKRLLELNFDKVNRERCQISLNLNITDIIDDDIYNMLLEHLDAIGDASRYFTFELLEEEQINDIELLRLRIASIHRTGAVFAVDDFGSGYSNFLNILSLDIDIIKIDGSLIREIHTSEVSRQMVKAITAFADASDKTVIAEFVHSEEVYDVVKTLGIRYMQGFYLAKPSPQLQEALV